MIKNPTKSYLTPIDEDSKFRFKKRCPTRWYTCQSIISQHLPKIFSEKANFPKELKFADITPVHEKESRHDKVNYRL